MHITDDDQDGKVRLEEYESSIIRSMRKMGVKIYDDPISTKMWWYIFEQLHPETLPEFWTYIKSSLLLKFRWKDLLVFKFQFPSGILRLNIIIIRTKMFLSGFFKKY